MVPLSELRNALFLLLPVWRTGPWTPQFSSGKLTASCGSTSPPMSCKAYAWEDPTRQRRLQLTLGAPEQAREVEAVAP